MNLQNLNLKDHPMDSASPANKMAALWGLGFRPMFLAGSLSAFGLMLLWVLFLLKGPHPVLSNAPTLWHAHEMVFGFGGAIIAGFLLTASANWANQKGVSGPRLMLLAGLWSAARILPLTGLNPLLGLAAELGFWLWLGWLLRPTLQGRNRIFWLLLSLILVADTLASLELAGIMLGSASLPGMIGIQLAVSLVISMIVLIAGRVLPFFAEKALPGVQILRKPRLDQLALGVTLAFALAQLLLPHSGWTAALAFLAGSIHLFRWQIWQPWQSRKIPILWILYLGYAWIILGFFLQGLAALEWVSRSTATHAWTAGAMGTFIYGMVSRVSLGHTGRPIQASGPILAGYLLLTLAVVLRLLPAVLPDLSAFLLATAGILWLLAFGLLLGVFLPIWTTPRIDGKPG
jgi:uncharacterized protein involved in response to NO